MSDFRVNNISVSYSPTAVYNTRVALAHESVFATPDGAQYIAQGRATNPSAFNTVESDTTLAQLAAKVLGRAPAADVPEKANAYWRGK
jgi:hypothetical protein